MRFFKFSTPLSVFGGKYSKEKNGFFSLICSAISSLTILSLGDEDTMTDNYEITRPVQICKKAP